MSGAFATATAVFGAASKAVAGVGATLGAVHLLRRSRPFQRRNILRALRAQARAAAATSEMVFPRPNATFEIRHILASPPVGPLVLSGAEGAGTSSVITDALREAGTDLLLRVDLRERAAGGQRTLMEHVVRASGFYFKNRDLAETGFLRSKKSELDAYEVEKCLGIIAEVLTDVKAKREAAESVRKWWVRNASPVSDLFVPRSTSTFPLPVLVLDELHQQQLPDASDSEGLHALLKWAIFITGAQLAHVVFITRPDVAQALDVIEPSFRSVR